MARLSKGVLVTGGGAFLGDKIASALLAEGESVSLLVRPGAEGHLGKLADSTRWSTADVWNPASLRGKARFHSAVVHTVGSLKADPSQGLTHHWLNTVSARNVADMCAHDGVERMILLSSANAPWISRSYIRSKRGAEDYLRRLGLRSTIVRAPLLYTPGSDRPLFYRLLTLLGAVPPLSWLYPGRIAPMPIDTFARAVALFAMAERESSAIVFARELRRRAKRESGASGSGNGERAPQMGNDLPGPLESMEENLPFGWSPEDEPG